MKATIKYRVWFYPATFSVIVAIYSVVLHPFLWRRATYHSLRQVIESGDEAKAIREVQRLYKKRLFQPDWTQQSALPPWRWVYDLDVRLFGCPSCRGNWRTLLHCAAQNGQPATVAELIRSGASIDSYGDRGCQALVSAVGGGNTNVIATLLAHGADVNATNFLGSVIHVAAGFSRQPDVLQFLLDAGAKPNAVDSRGWTALDWASVYNPKAKPILIAHGAVAGTNRLVALPTTSVQN
ncbi:MAG TPA: ankyrin repeat domain-containing protein [Verrucomicrobiae bacterium]|nr:ankyrin repeat domain-containing protein [Verrucomicrobiae bacterium]